MDDDQLNREAMTYQQRCDAYAAEVNALGDAYGVHALVASFCFDEADGVMGKTMVLGCPEHCKMIERIGTEGAKYIRMTDEAVKNLSVGQVH